jgi:hypothetical protein
MDITRRTFCLLSSSGVGLLGGCAGLDNIAKEVSESGKTKNPEEQRKELLHENQSVFLGAGEVYGEGFVNKGENTLEFTVDDLERPVPGFARVYTEVEWEKFKSEFESTGELNGGTATYEGMQVPGPQTVEITKNTKYFIALGLRQSWGVGDDSTTTSTNAKLEYWVFD